MDTNIKYASPVSAACAIFMLLWNVAPVLSGKTKGASTRTASNTLPWWRRPIPAMTILVVLAWVPLLLGFIGHTQDAEKEASPSRTERPESMPPRSKQTISDLLGESGKIAGVIKTGLPLANEWRESITGRNPERVCLDLDSTTLQDKTAALANKLIAANDEISNVFEQNRIDQAELNQLFPNGNVGGFAYAAAGLQIYQRGIAALGERPPCEQLIRLGNVNSPQ